MNILREIKNEAGRGAYHFAMVSGSYVHGFGSDARSTARNSPRRDDEILIRLCENEETGTGFALTENAFQDALDRSGMRGQLNRLLQDLHRANSRDLANRAASARDIVLRAMELADVREQVMGAYRCLQRDHGENVAVNVTLPAGTGRGPASATGRTAISNIRGEEQVFDACKHAMASFFSDGAIRYRDRHRMDHFKTPHIVLVRLATRKGSRARGIGHAPTAPPATGARLGRHFIGGSVHALSSRDSQRSLGRRRSPPA